MNGYLIVGRDHDHHNVPFPIAEDDWDDDYNNGTVYIADSEGKFVDYVQVEELQDLFLWREGGFISFNEYELGDAVKVYGWDTVYRLFKYGKVKTLDEVFEQEQE